MRQPPSNEVLRQKWPEPDLTWGRKVPPTPCKRGNRTAESSTYATRNVKHQQLPNIGAEETDFAHVAGGIKPVYETFLQA